MKRALVWRTAIVLLALLLSGAALPAGARSTVRLTLWTHHRHMEDLTRELIGEFNRSEGRRLGIEVSQRVLGDEAWYVFQEAQRHGDGPDLYSAGFATKYADPFAAGDRKSTRLNSSHH